MACSGTALPFFYSKAIKEQQKMNHFLLANKEKLRESYIIAGNIW
jgi:hypothetical protein